MTPSVRRDTINPGTEVKHVNPPGKLKIGKRQYDSNAAIAGLRDQYRAQGRADRPVSLAVGAGRETVGVEGPPSHGRARSGRAGPCPLPDLQAGAQIPRSSAYWFWYENESGDSEIGRRNDGRAGRNMGLTGRFPYVPSNVARSAAPICGMIDETSTISAAATTLAITPSEHAGPTQKTLHARAPPK